MLTLVTAMAIEGDELTVTLDRGERWWGLLPDLRVPLSSIVAVEVVRDGRAAVRGMRAPGLGGPKRRIGTWRAKDDKQYVSVRRDRAGREGDPPRPAVSHRAHRRRRRRPRRGRGADRSAPLSRRSGTRDQELLAISLVPATIVSARGARSGSFYGRSSRSGSSATGTWHRCHAATRCPEESSVGGQRPMPITWAPHGAISTRTWRPGRQGRPAAGNPRPGAETLARRRRLIRARTPGAHGDPARLDRACSWACTRVLPLHGRRVPARGPIGVVFSPGTDRPRCPQRPGRRHRTTTVAGRGRPRCGFAVTDGASSPPRVPSAAVSVHRAQTLPSSPFSSAVIDASRLDSRPPRNPPSSSPATAQSRLPSRLPAPGTASRSRLTSSRATAQPEQVEIERSEVEREEVACARRGHHLLRRHEAGRSGEALARQGVGGPVDRQPHVVSHRPVAELALQPAHRVQDAAACRRTDGA